MVKAYDLVAITCIMNGPFDNESTKTSNGQVRRVAKTFNSM